ncbi:hypothetical protein IGI96_001750 [Enterococcus sp. DIV0421]
MFSLDLGAFFVLCVSTSEEDGEYVWLNMLRIFFLFYFMDQ